MKRLKRQCEMYDAEKPLGSYPSLFLFVSLSLYLSKKREKVIHTSPLEKRQVRNEEGSSFRRMEWNHGGPVTKSHRLDFENACIAWIRYTFSRNISER